MTQIIFLFFSTLFLFTFKSSMFSPWFTNWRSSHHTDWWVDYYSSLWVWHKLHTRWRFTADLQKWRILELRWTNMWWDTLFNRTIEWNFYEIKWIRYNSFHFSPQNIKCLLWNLVSTTEFSILEAMQRLESKHVISTFLVKFTSRKVEFICIISSFHIASKNSMVETGFCSLYKDILIGAIYFWMNPLSIIISSKIFFSF